MKFFLKKILILFLISPSFLAVLACSNSSGDLSSEYEVTLMDRTNNIKKSIEWTDELEGEILTADISKIKGIDSARIAANPYVLFMNETNDSKEKIFPYVEGFGSLDLRGFSKDELKGQKEFVDDFCANFCQYKDCDSFFEENSIFSLAMFYSELKSNWKNNFSIAFPEPGDDDLKASEKKSSDEKEAAGKGKDSSKEAKDAKDGIGKDDKDSKNGKDSKEDETEASVPLFDSYMLGEPFSAPDLFSVPVRFKTEKTFRKNAVDAQLYLKKKEEKWKLDDIQITRWILSDGSMKVREENSGNQ